MKLDVSLNVVPRDAMCSQLYEHRGNYTPKCILQTLFIGLLLFEEELFSTTGKQSFPEHRKGA